MSSDDTRLLAAAQAAEAYGVDELDVARYVKHFRHAGGFEPTGPYINRLIEATINTAAAHADCREDTCPTCDRIVESLALVVAVLQVRMDEQLEELVDPRAGRAERSVAIGRAAPSPGRVRGLRGWLLGWRRRR